MEPDRLFGGKDHLYRIGWEDGYLEHSIRYQVMQGKFEVLYLWHAVHTIEQVGRYEEVGKPT